MTRSLAHGAAALSAPRLAAVVRAASRGVTRSGQASNASAPRVVAVGNGWAMGEGRESGAPSADNRVYAARACTQDVNRRTPAC